MLKIKPIYFFIALLSLCGGVFLLSLCVGASSVRLPDILQILGQGNVAPINSSDIYIITELRLPRTILAFLVGAALALTGAVLQTLFRNPLADPSLIGVSSGAALGAAIMLVLGGTLMVNFTLMWMTWLVYLSAFAGGILVTVIVMRVGQSRYKMSLGTLLLVGIAINALATSGIGLLIYIANETTLRSLTFWMLGSLTQATWSTVGITALFVMLAVIFIPFYAKALNALLLGEADAYHLGIPVEKVKYRLLFCCALAISATVAIAGMIGFVGLVVPHMVRMLIGSNHRYVLPGSVILGGTLLMLADIGARTWVAPAEMPIGIITALLGAPFFLFLILRAKQ